jgi:tetratricopeptide (TPR) repeat protein
VLSLLVVLAAAAEPGERAKVIFKEGKDLYAIGQYEDAAAKFQQAYKLSQHPLLLYNLSLTYERLGDLPKARDYLRDYLPHTSGNERVVLGQRLVSFEQRLQEAAQARLDEQARKLEEARLRLEEEQKRNQEAADANRIAAEQSLLAAEQAKLTEERAKLVEAQRRLAEQGASAIVGAAPEGRSPWPGTLLVAAGAVTVAAGALSGYLSYAAKKRAEDEGHCVDGQCTDAAKDLLQKNRDYALYADIGYGVGGALIVGGLVYLLWPEGESTVTLAPGPITTLRVRF